jgi:CTP synthase
MEQKLIFVTGGVVSGLGKGITTASIGRILLSRGFNMTCVKIDPYLNSDAGTMRPTEHGEVFVTDDGGEIDQDLGNYERFLNKSLTKRHNITTGQVYKTVIDRERRGDYLGKTVQPIPHITDEIKSRIMEIAKNYEITLVEIGGTVGDYENTLFLEAARQMRRERGLDNVVFAHVSYIVELDCVGEQKTKPTQHSVKMLREIGIEPDFLICRSKHNLDDVRIDKLALFCNMDKEAIISNQDVGSIYDVPALFEEQKLGDKLLKRMALKEKENKFDGWLKIAEKLKNNGKTVRVGMVGKYVAIGNFQLADSYISVNEAIKHAAAELGANAKIEWIDSCLLEKDPDAIKILDTFDGIIVPGGFGSSGVEGKIMAIRYCRENNIPYLGLCFGLQLAVVEHARNVCGLGGAHSTEIDPQTKHPVIDILPEQKTVTYKGATMRLGEYPAVLKKGSKVHKLYEKLGLNDGDTAHERHRHRYEVNPEYTAILEKNGLIFSGTCPNRRLMEFCELRDHRFFIGTQSHPEFKSRPGSPSPLFFGFIEAALRK